MGCRTVFSPITITGNTMTDLLAHEFMRNAFVAGLLISIACGIVGTLVVVNRLTFLAGGVAHAAYGGLGLSVFLGWPMMAGTVLFTLVSSLCMGAVSRQNRQRSDAVIGVMWALGMAMGILLIDLKGGYYVDLMSYLFGSILAVSSQSLLMMVVMVLVIAAAVLILYKEILGMSYDEEFSLISGVPVAVLYYLVLALIAFTIVMLIRVVGLILVIALLTIPATVAEMITRDLKRMMLMASGFGILFSVSGLLVSYYLDLTSGASIVLMAGLGYVIALAVRGLKSQNRRVKVRT
jgi:zinc transport system permease protein